MKEKRESQRRRPHHPKKHPLLKRLKRRSRRGRLLPRSVFRRRTQRSLAMIPSTSLTMSQLRRMNPQRLTIRNESVARRRSSPLNQRRRKQNQRLVVPRRLRQPMRETRKTELISLMRPLRSCFLLPVVLSCFYCCYPRALLSYVRVVYCDR